MIGTIQQANKSKSGKTLSIQVDGQWYTSKNWELEQAIGKRIIFEPSVQAFPDGGSCQWLNDYTFEDAVTTPAAQAMDAAMQNNPHGASQAMPPTPPASSYEAPRETPVKDRDASIVAQALTKSCTAPGDDIELVWSRYTAFYQKYMGWDSTCPF